MLGSKGAGLACRRRWTSLARAPAREAKRKRKLEVELLVRGRNKRRKKTSDGACVGGHRDLSVRGRPRDAKGFAPRGRCGAAAASQSQQKEERNAIKEESKHAKEENDEGEKQRSVIGEKGHCF